MSFRSRRRRNPSGIAIMNCPQGKFDVVALNFSSQTPFPCIVTGISPLALRNDMKNMNFRTQVIRFSTLFSCHLADNPQRFSIFPRSIRSHLSFLHPKLRSIRSYPSFFHKNRDPLAHTLRFFVKIKTHSLTPLVFS